MADLSLEANIAMKISDYKAFENIVNSCIERYHADGNIDGSSKKDFFNKCVQTKAQIYQRIDKKYPQRSQKVFAAFSG